DPEDGRQRRRAHGSGVRNAGVPGPGGLKQEGGAMAATHKLFVWRGRPAVLAAATLALLAACTEPAAPGGSTALQSLAADSAGTTASGAAASPPDCPAEPGVRYLCGLSNAEDILRIGD